MFNIVKTILDTTLKNKQFNCPSNITDLVFLEIEKHFIKEYKSALVDRSINALNSSIGKYIREYWNLRNTGRFKSPSSRLIKSYETHSN